MPSNLRSILREFNEEATGIVFWSGFTLGLMLGVMISVVVLLYFNFKVMI